MIDNDDAQFFLNESFQLAEGDQYINATNLALVIIFASASIISFVASIHSIIDKLFFKKFYENPNYFVAIRRGLIFDLMFVSVIVLRLLGLLELVTAISAIFLLVLIELTFTSYSRKTKKSSPVESKKEDQGNKENK